MRTATVCPPLRASLHTRCLRGARSQVVRDYVDGVLDGLLREHDGETDEEAEPAQRDTIATVAQRRRSVIVCASRRELDEMLFDEDLIFTLESASRATLRPKKRGACAAGEAEGGGENEAVAEAPDVAPS